MILEVDNTTEAIIASLQAEIESNLEPLSEIKNMQDEIRSELTSVSSGVNQSIDDISALQTIVKKLERQNEELDNRLNELLEISKANAEKLNLLVESRHSNVRKCVIRNGRML